jgi:hypothetical protein
MSRPNGLTIYRGPSRLDGAPIIAIATGLANASRNNKTGSMVQIWIMREDQSPSFAVNSGADASICGDCRHRGRIVDGRNVGRSCYVTIMHAPRNVWSSYHRGLYPAIDNVDNRAFTPFPALTDLAAAFAGRAVRLGAYGDPAAVPVAIWQQIASTAAYWTGYTHQWRTAPELARFVMASCDTEREREEARALGFRTFRVRSLAEPVLSGEVSCPASAEMGKKTNCAACKACGGLSAKAKVDIVIAAHGAGARNFETMGV